MNTIDKKDDILQKLQSTNDEQLIEEFMNYYILIQSLKVLLSVICTKNCKIKINRALDAYRNGSYITHGQIQQMVEQWLISGNNSCNSWQKFVSSYLTKSNNVAVKIPCSRFLKITFQFPL